MISFNEKIDNFINEYCRLFKFSGALRVCFHDEIIYERFIGCADYENNIPINVRSVYTLYSLSKPFCAIGLLKLKDKGLVDINSHPAVYVPEMSGFDKRITIRHMLQHTSGMPDFAQTKGFASTYHAGPPDKIREQLTILSSYPMYFVPGTASMYANINFIVCALIIENVSGLSYADYMKREVFEPLGMQTARVDQLGLEISNLVKGYEIDGKDFVSVEKCRDWMLGAGDIVGTLDDVYCLNKAIKHHQLLKHETWDEILTPSSLNQMGMGCTVSEWHGKLRITHNGGHIGFRTLHVQLLEDDLDIILLIKHLF